MREAMYRAEVGDDVFGDDPTVNHLQELAAEMLGKEAGLLVPSGTMGNLAAILAHCGRGEEAILGDKAHSVLYEAGGISALGGVHSRQIPNQADGSLLLEDIRQAIRSDDAHFPVTRLVGLENTHNRCGGTLLPLEYMREVGGLVHERGLVLHLDGARLFNAAAALKVSARELAAPADSITFCLSKALCAPVGSVIVGNKEFIQRAHRIRKQLGGGMRQAGVLAAAGIVALETMTERLAEDHARARRLAAGLAQIPGVLLDPGTPHTNMIFFSLADELPLDAAQASQRLQELEILVVPSGRRRFRLVTHFWIDDLAIDMAIGAFQQVLSA